MKVLEYLARESSKRTLHLTLIDPDKQKAKEAGEIARSAARGGTRGIMVGGSVGISPNNLDATVEAIKERVDLPVILFPGDVAGISTKADAIFFMSLLNSRNPYYITGAQAAGAPLVKRAGIEAIPMGYIVVEPGGAAGYVGDARLIPRDRPEVAVGYALAAEFLGMRLVYLEAGSGASQPVPGEMITAVKKAIEIPLIVGGGIRDGKAAARAAKAGADIIVTGTIVEKTKDVGKKIGKITAAIADA